MFSQALQEGYGAWVRCDAHSVSVSLGQGVEKLSWAQLQSVSIEAQGQDLQRRLAWRLQGLGVRRCLIPFGCEGEPELLQYLQQLAGFDVLAVADALCGSAEGRFICWRRERLQP